MTTFTHSHSHNDKMVAVGTLLANQMACQGNYIMTTITLLHVNYMLLTVAYVYTHVHVGQDEVQEKLAFLQLSSLLHKKGTESSLYL